MCVTVAMKLPRDRKTGKPTPDAKWRLAKIRDRLYDPVYHVKRYTVSKVGASQIFLVDDDTDWTEGLSVKSNETFLSMVNSALNNTADKKDGKDKGKNTPNETVAVNGKVIRAALRSHDIEDAVKQIIENKIDGCTLITDGDRLFVIETTLPSEVKEKYRDKKGEDQRFEDIVPLSEYKTKTKEIKGDYLVVRTNHGVLDESFGYQPQDGDSFKSSVKRREYVTKILEEKAFEPLDLVGNLSKMGRDEIDKNPFFRPIRLKGKAKNDLGIEIYSTSIIQTDPSGTMIVKPIECTFKINNMQNLIDDDYLAHMVILPQRSRMFESFNRFLEHYDLKDNLA
jgi:hypothetical protein